MKIKSHFLILLLVAFAFAVYANSIKGPFLLDDNTLVEANPLVKSMSDISKFFKRDIFAHAIDSRPISNSYRPLQMITYAIDFFLWSNDPKGFHLTNILIHIFNVILVFLLVKKLFNNKAISFFVSLLFAINPVNTSCVSYISGRADILVAAFMLLSIIFYIDYSKNNRRVFLFLSVLWYLFSVYSKEYAILTLPFILLIYSLVFSKKNAFSIASFALPLVIYFPMRARALTGLMTKSLELSRIDLFSRVWTSLKTLFIDIRILLFPYDLHFGRTTQLERSVFGSAYSMLTLLGFLGCIYMLTVVYRRWAREKRPMHGMIFFGALWFFVSMMPLLNIIPLQVFHSDNWLYLSSIGIYLAVASAAGYLWQFLSKNNILQKLFFGLICLILLSYGLATVERNKDYKDVIRFYLSSVRWRPNVKFYRALGALYGSKGDFDNAIKYSKKAIETNRIYPSPEVFDAYYNLGLSYLNVKRYKEAEGAFKEVMKSGNEGLNKEAERYLLYIRELH